MRFHLTLLAIIICSNSYCQIIDDFELMDATSNENFSMSSLKNRKAVVVIFTSNGCPYDKLYHDRIVALSSDYKNQGVEIVLINSNSPKSSPVDNLAAMKSKATKNNFNFPYLADGQQKISKQFGAKKTPEAFLLKPNGSQYHVVYNGAIDDNPQNATDVSKAFLRDAIQSFLGTGSTSTKSQRPVGCMIKS
ncbi:MAG: thioredoxin family protein [Cyclobacteriaceae bacterium]